MRFAVALLVLCTVCGCRLGEPAPIQLNAGAGAGTGGAGAADPMPSGGGASAGSGGAGGTSGATSGAAGMAGEGSSGAGGSDAGAGSSASGGTDATHEPDAAMTGDAGTSCSPDVQACNPVTNDGCPDAMQCAVDLASDVLAGYCIFSSPPMDGGCFNSGVTESCPPTSTCFELECRTLCLCDADCEAGQCCKDAVGDRGFKVCGAC